MSVQLGLCICPHTMHSPTYAIHVLAQVPVMAVAAPAPAPQRDMIVLEVQGPRRYVVNMVTEARVEVPGVLASGCICAFARAFNMDSGLT